MFLAAIWLAMLITAIGASDNPGFSGWASVWTIPAWVCLLLAGAWLYPATQAYERGVAAAQNGEWRAAVAHFEAAQSSIPYMDSGVALAEGLSYGWLAAENDDYLPGAIAAYERLIAHEPGWPTNYANLAALYWQAGDVEKALALMRQAQAIAPKTPLYTLNLALWQETVGDEEAAVANYKRLAALNGIWSTPLFWEATPARQAAVFPSQPVSEHDAGWQALQNQNWGAAEVIYSGLLQENPRDGAAYTGLGILYLFMGNETAAQDQLARAMLLNRRHAYIWAFLLDDPTGEFLTMFRQHNSFGLTRSNAHIYPAGVLSRPGLPYDLLPQLHCFSLDDSVSQHIALLENWPPLDKVLLQSLLADETEGLIPCTQP
jgi:tetratricopeptide (TPR) repeat protein